MGSGYSSGSHVHKILKKMGHVFDASADGFWGGQRTYFDAKVFDPTAPSYSATSVPSLYRRFEREKRRKYGRGSGK